MLDRNLNWHPFGDRQITPAKAQLLYACYDHCRTIEELETQFASTQLKKEPVLQELYEANWLWLCLKDEKRYFIASAKARSAIKSHRQRSPAFTQLCG